MAHVGEEIIALGCILQLVVALPPSPPLRHFFQCGFYGSSSHTRAHVDFAHQHVAEHRQVPAGTPRQSAPPAPSGWLAPSPLPLPRQPVSGLPFTTNFALPVGIRSISGLEARPWWRSGAGTGWQLSLPSTSPTRRIF